LRLRNTGLKRFNISLFLFPSAKESAHKNVCKLKAKYSSLFNPACLDADAGCHGYSLSLEKQPLYFLRSNIPPLAALLIDSLASDKHGRLAVFTHGDAEEPDSKKEER